VSADGSGTDDARLGVLPTQPASVGAWLRHFRLRAGISQESLAERAGLGLSTLKALERDQRQQPRPHTLTRLVAALGLTATERDALLEGVAWRGVPATPPGADHPPTPPAPASPAATPLLRLPLPPTPLIGREAEVAQLSVLLDPTSSAIRLLTLLGPGGVGKTRLAVAAAGRLGHGYPDGVIFVDLAPLRDERLVPATIARALGVQEYGGRSGRELLLDHLYDKRLLLVLDNFEHLLGAAPLLAELLASSAALRVLVTSRSALRVRGERRLTVAPLATPTETPDAGGWVVTAATPAVRLFIERAQASEVSDLVLDGTTAAAVAAICRRLDGLPLAIELAAARVGLLGPEALLRRLEHRLPVLTGGAPDLPARQQTLRATLGWSYDLLAPGEQVLFRRLGVFAGGWNLEAAEAVCAGDDLAAHAVLEGLARLVDHSLIQRTSAGDGEPRLGILECIHEYALELLTSSDDEAVVRRAHAAHYLALAEQAETELAGPRQSHWLAILEREHDNIRGALQWAAATDVEVGLRLAGAIRQFWWVHGHLAEGRRWLDELLACSREGSDQVAPDVRARALNAAGNLAFGQADYPQARAAYAASLAVGQTTADPIRIGIALHNLGFAAAEQGDTAQAEALLEQSLALARAQDAGPRHLAIRLTTLGDVVRQQGDLPRAKALLLEAAASLRQLGDALWLEGALTNLGHVARDAGQWSEALACYTEALGISRTLSANYSRGLARCLEGLASVAIARQQAPRAVRLLGAAARLRDTMGAPVAPAALTGYSQTLARARQALGEAAFAAALAEGRAHTPDQAIAEALSLTPDHEVPAWVAD
jgi:predicted ATPase